LLSGKSLVGKYAAFAPMLKGFIEKALEAEMSEYLLIHQKRTNAMPKGLRP
jgi:putative transposase